MLNAAQSIDSSKFNIALDLSQRHSVLYAKCRNAILGEFRGQLKGKNMGRSAIRNMLFVVIKEIGGKYHSSRVVNGKHFDAYVEFTDGSKAKFLNTGE